MGRSKGKKKKNKAVMKESPIQPIESTTPAPTLETPAYEKPAEVAPVVEETPVATAPVVEPAPIVEEVVEEPVAVKEEPKKEVSKPALPEKVTIKQLSTSNWLDKGHDGYDQYTGTSRFLTVQNRSGSKELITGLTSELEVELEAKLGLPGKSATMPAGTLSKYSDFWKTFKIEIPKGGKTLYLSDPRQELEYHVLLVHQKVANSQAGIRENGFAQFVLTSEEEEAVEGSKTYNVKSRAYNKARNMSTSTMKGFLRVYNRLNNHNVTVSNDSTLNFLESAVGVIIDESPEKFLDVIENDNYKTMLFIDECISANVIRQERTKYFLVNGDILGTTLETTIDYLNDVNNQQIKFILTDQIAANK